MKTDESQLELVEFQKRKLVKKTDLNEEDKQSEDDQSENTQELDKNNQDHQSHEDPIYFEGEDILCRNKQKQQAIISLKRISENQKSESLKVDQLKNRAYLRDEKIRQNNQLDQSKKLEVKFDPNINNQSKDKQKIQLTLKERRTINILAVSDNHGDYKSMNQILDQKGDIFIHAGDFTYQGKDQDFQKFFSFLDKLKFRHKIVIAGNHENILSKLKLKTITKMSRQKIISEIKKRSIYLEHQMIEVEGVKIFASPYTPEYCQKPTSRAFQYKPSHDKTIWSEIPKDIDLLITHGPPFGILDNGKNGKRAGSQALREAVLLIKPRYHIFGHIHESKGGIMKIEKTTFVNLCNTPTRLVIDV